VCVSSAAQNLEVGSRFLENFWTTSLLYPKMLSSVQAVAGRMKIEYPYYLLPGGARKRQGAAGSKTTP